MSLAKLTSISTTTLSLLLQLQRQQSSQLNLSNSNTPAQIQSNLVQLREGILSREAKSVDSGEQQSLGLLRNQYERMRNILAGLGITDVEPMTQEGPSKSKSSSTEALYTPYKDDPEAGRPFLDDTDDQDPGELIQTQRQLMDEQDTHLDLLSHSINRQRDISLQINSELTVHEGLLESLDTDLDRTDNRLSHARTRLNRFAEGAKKNGSTVTIAALIFILLILIIVLKT